MDIATNFYACNNVFNLIMTMGIKTNQKQKKILFSRYKTTIHRKNIFFENVMLLIKCRILKVLNRLEEYIAFS